MEEEIPDQFTCDGKVLSGRKSLLREDRSGGE